MKKMNVHKRVVMLMGWLVFLETAMSTAQHQERSFQKAVLSNSNAFHEDHQSQPKYFKTASFENFESKLEITPMNVHLSEMIALGDTMDFMVMDLSQSHHVAVRIFDKNTSETITNADVNLIVKTPDSIMQKKDMYWLPMMKYFGEDFDFSRTGSYEMICRVKMQGKSYRRTFKLQIERTN